MILHQNYVCAILLAAGQNSTSLGFQLPMNQFFETYKEVSLIKIRHLLIMKRNDINLGINDGDTNAGALRQIHVSYFSVFPLPIRDYGINSISGVWMPQNNRWDSTNHYDTIYTFLRIEHDTQLNVMSRIDTDTNMTLPTDIRLEIQYFFEVF